MRRQGMVRTWRDEKGFGFIVPGAGGADVFFHVSSVTGAGGRRPQVGDTVEFDTTIGTDGKTKAVGVRYVGAIVISRPNPVPTLMATFCVGASVFLLVRTALPVVLAYPVFGLFTYAVYAHDKKAAQKGGYRVPEAHLHLLELLGGWIGGYIAQERLRHKSAKPSYQTAFWTIAVLHVVGWVGWLCMMLMNANQ